MIVNSGTFSIRGYGAACYGIPYLSGSFYACFFIREMIRGQAQRSDDTMKLLANESDSVEMLALVVLSLYILVLGLVFLL